MTFLARREFSTLHDRMNRIARETFSPERSDEALTTVGIPQFRPSSVIGSQYIMADIASFRDAPRKDVLAARHGRR